MPKRKEVTQTPPKPPTSSRHGLNNPSLSPQPAPQALPSLPKRGKVTVEKSSKPRRNKHATSDMGATLPEEILLAILAHVKPLTAQYVSNSSKAVNCKEFWTPSQLLNLALVSKRLHGIVVPLFLAPALEGWIHRYVKLKYRKRLRGWAPILKMVLEFSVLRTYLKQVKVEMGEGNAWQTLKEGEEVDSGRVLVKRDVWAEEDFERADNMVDELCGRDIWEEFPVKSREQGAEQMVGVEEMGRRWKEHVRLGRSDAL